MPRNDLHPLAERFAGVADSYERGRPDYPPAVVGALAAELSLAPAAPVLDLGAGTGKLSRALLAAGLDVVAVEPLDSMRSVLTERLGQDRVRSGRAEAIPLPDHSVDAVTVADAFHWFDHQRALREIRRVLAPGGAMAVLTVTPDWSGASWAHEVGNLLQSSRPEHPNFDGPGWQEKLQADGGWQAIRELRITIAQPVIPERVVDYLRSVSWIAGMADAERTATLGRVRELVRAGHTPDEMPQHFNLGLAELRR